jgi:hypothetical protein
LREFDGLFSDGNSGFLTTTNLHVTQAADLVAVSVLPLEKLKESKKCIVGPICNNPGLQQLLMGKEQIGPNK